MSKFIVLSILGMFLFACNKEDNLLHDSNYPTTINALDTKTLEQKRLAFLSQNGFIASSLDEFGFCNPIESALNSPQPPLTSPLTEPQAIEKAKKFIDQNKDYLGVVEPDKINISKAWLSTGYYDGGTMWRIDTHYQKYDTIQVLFQTSPSSSKIVR